jgi:hypothetical protein
MKIKINSLPGAVLALLVLTLTANAAIQVYDLKTDWSDTQNPNGAWSYRSLYYGELMINDPFAWASASYPNEGWIRKITSSSVVPGYLEVGDVSLGTPYGLQVFPRWTAPASGTITISATMWQVNPDMLSFVYIVLLHNGSLLQEHPGGALGTRTSPDELLALNVPVQAGDTIDLSCQEGVIGLNFTVNFTTDSVDPVGAIEDLALTVVEMNLQNGIENSLDSKLDAALDALVDANFNNDGAPCNSLAAFISAVEAQRGKKITSAQADQLIASAQQIKAMLNCGN